MFSASDFKGSDLDEFIEYSVNWIKFHISA
jgi:hypothetical protein